jgi:hypothetical protein
MTVRQIVLFRFPQGRDQAFLARLDAGLRELVAAAPDVADASWGLDVGGEIGGNAGNHDFALVMDFADGAALARYKKHPAHVRFIETYMRAVPMEKVRIQYFLPAAAGRASA